MKQNTEIMRVPTPSGYLNDQHTQVTAFWFNRLPSHRPHIRTKTWTRWELLYTVGGEGLLTWANNGQLTLRTRMAVLLAPHTECTYRTAPGAEEWHQDCFTFLPRPHWYNWLRWPIVAPGIMLLEATADSDSKRIRQATQHAIRMAYTPNPLWEDFTMAALERVLLLFHELQSRARENGSPSQQQDTDPRLQAALDFIEKKQGKSLTREQIAAACGISGDYLRVLFQKHLKTTPQQYLDTFRINKAQRLLRETNKTISEIGRIVGYDQLTHFCRRFRKLTGHSPGEYREVLK